MDQRGAGRLAREKRSWAWKSNVSTHGLWLSFRSPDRAEPVPSTALLNGGVSMRRFARRFGLVACGTLSLFAAGRSAPAQEFLRGDVSGDGRISLVDPAFLLRWFFGGMTEPPCLSATDVNLDRDVNIADSIVLLNFLFHEGREPLDPFPSCGEDPFPGPVLPCEEPPPCGDPIPAPAGPFTLFVTIDPEIEVPLGGRLFLGGLPGEQLCVPFYVLLRGRLEDGRAPTGWSFGLLMEGDGLITELTLEETAVSALGRGGFSTLLPALSPGGFGYTTAVLLSFFDPTSLAEDVGREAHVILRGTIRAQAPGGGGQSFLSLRLVAGLRADPSFRGNGQPVEIEVVVDQEAFAPELQGIEFDLFHADPFGLFVRGDSNDDLKHDVSDVISTLEYLFNGGPNPPCPDAADANDDGRIEISDPIYSLGCLFLGGRCPRRAGLTCEDDPNSMCVGDETPDEWFCDDAFCFFQGGIDGGG
jgi:hypothetical protein